MLLSDLTTEMLREWSEAQDKADKVTLMEQFIRDGLDELALDADFISFRNTTDITTVAGTAQYALPVACREVTAMRIASLDRPLIQRSVQYLKLSFLDLELQDVPTDWAFVGSDPVSNQTALRVQLYPVPDAIYVIEVAYILHPAALTSSDVIPIHNQYKPMLKHKIRYKMALDDNNIEAADRHDANYVREIQNLRTREHRTAAGYLTMDVTDIRRRVPNVPIFDPNHFRN